MVRDFRAIRTFELKWKEMESAGAPSGATAQAEKAMGLDLSSRLDAFLEEMEEDGTF